MDPSDPRVREAEAFPSLTADQVERVSRFGVVQRLPAGTVLFEPGARRVDFFLVLDGFIEAYASRGTAQQVVHVYGEQQFTGELNLFNDRAILVGGRMGGDGRVARLNCSQFRQLLAAEPDIANVVIRAIILRRERMFLHAQTGVTIIAPRRFRRRRRLRQALRERGVGDASARSGGMTSEAASSARTAACTRADTTAGMDASSLPSRCKKAKP